MFNGEWCAFYFAHALGSREPIQIMLLAGGDLIQSFAVPNLWKEADVLDSGFTLAVGPHFGKFWMCHCGKDWCKRA